MQNLYTLEVPQTLLLRDLLKRNTLSGEYWKRSRECGNLTYNVFFFYAYQSQPLQI